nr:MAG TPA: hypothetical protein [Bacteriophage sp.]
MNVSKLLFAVSNNSPKLFLVESGSLRLFNISPKLAKSFYACEVVASTSIPKR